MHVYDVHVLEGTEDSQSTFVGSASAVPSAGTPWTMVATSANHLWNNSSITRSVSMMLVPEELTVDTVGSIAL